MSIKPIEDYRAEGWDDKLSKIFTEMNAADAEFSHLLAALTQDQRLGSQPIPENVEGFEELRTAQLRIKSFLSKADPIIAGLKDEVSGTPEICDLSHGPGYHRAEINAKWGGLKFEGMSHES